MSNLFFFQNKIKNKNIAHYLFVDSFSSNFTIRILVVKITAISTINLFTSSGPFSNNSLDRSTSNNRVSGYFILLPCFTDIPVFNANSIDPDQMPQNVASDLLLQCLLITLLGVSPTKSG